MIAIIIIIDMAITTSSLDAVQRNQGFPRHTKPWLP
jgi:hypothetical protein